MHPFKVIREAVHGDIWITELEKEIIDTYVYQRLRQLRQLGLSYLVYPSALHTRFEHCLGTLYVAQQIMDRVNKNAEKFDTDGIQVREIFLIRIIALLHDLAHLPYGHTLETEGKLFGTDEQWLDKDRRDYLLRERIQGNESIINIIKNGIISAFKSVNDEKTGDQEAEECLKEIEDALIAEEEGEERTKTLSKPYIVDIVGNTICADLIDYLRRDSSFSGVNESYDERFLSYFIITKSKETENKLRLVLMLQKSGLLRRDTLSTVIDLLNLRYSQAEKIYYHHTTVVASAMVIKMVSAAINSGKLNKKHLYTMGDDSLIWCIEHFLKEDGMTDADKIEDLKAAKRLAKKVRRREIYKPVYKLDELTLTARLEAEKIIKELEDDWRLRYALETHFENLLGLDRGSVVIYSPKRQGKSKPAETKVLFDNEIFPLNKLGNKKKEFEALDKELDVLDHKHRLLWNFYVFLDRNIYFDVSGNLSETAKDLAGLCETEFKITNTIPELSNLSRSEMRVIAERTSDINIPISKLGELERGYEKALKGSTRPSNAYDRYKAREELCREILSGYQQHGSD
jgi:hypothetical protein